MKKRTTTDMSKRVFLTEVPGREEFNACVRAAEKKDVRRLRAYAEANRLNRAEITALVRLLSNVLQKNRRGIRNGAKGSPRFDPVIHRAAREAWDKIVAAKLNIEQGYSIIQAACDKRGIGDEDNVKTVRNLLKRHKSYGDRIKVSSAT